MLLPDVKALVQGKTTNVLVDVLRLILHVMLNAVDKLYSAKNVRSTSDFSFKHIIYLIFRMSVHGRALLGRLSLC